MPKKRKNDGAADRKRHERKLRKIERKLAKLEAKIRKLEKRREREWAAVKGAAPSKPRRKANPKPKSRPRPKPKAASKPKRKALRRRPATPAALPAPVTTGVQPLPAPPAPPSAPSGGGLGPSGS